jgi:hypothetical protein
VNKTPAQHASLHRRRHAKHFGERPFDARIAEHFHDLRLPTQCATLPLLLRICNEYRIVCLQSILEFDSMDNTKGQLLRGAAAIAEQVFGDRKKARSIYQIADELPLFWMGGMMCGWSSTIDEHLAAKERAGLRRRRNYRRLAA